jgi:hypothetical protein
MKFPAPFQGFNGLFEGDSEMEQRDWELLDKQLRGQHPPQNDGLIVLTVAAVFFAGMILGSLLVPHESELMRIALNDARTVISLANGASPTDEHEKRATNATFITWGR